MKTMSLFICDPLARHPSMARSLLPQSLQKPTGFRADKGPYRNRLNADKGSYVQINADKCRSHFSQVVEPKPKTT